MADVTFDEPEGFVPPENLDSDNTFQAMATFKVLPGNKLTLVDIEGYELDDEAGESPEQERQEQEAGGGQPAPAPAAQGSADRLAAGAAGTATAGYAERLGQMFRTRMAQARARTAGRKT
jgi:hypothetical protein